MRAFRGFKFKILRGFSWGNDSFPYIVDGFRAVSQDLGTWGFGAVEFRI